MAASSRRKFLTLLLADAGALSGIGCGTVLHPERRGQPAGPLDWKIVALDTVGLLLFFVPGVIAFAVDFNNGTIYLPPDQYGRKRPDAGEDRMVSIEVPHERLSVGNLERIVSRHTEREVRLVPGTYQAEELESLEDFRATADRLAAR